MKRRWFGLHTTTVILIGVLMTIQLILQFQPMALMKATSDSLEARGYGHPAPYWYVGWEKAYVDNNGTIGKVPFKKFELQAFGISILCNSLVIAGVAFYSERFIRRREARKP